MKYQHPLISRYMQHAMLVMQEIKLIDKIENNDTCNYIILFIVIVNLQLYIYIYILIYLFIYLFVSCLSQTSKTPAGV